MLALVSHISKRPVHTDMQSHRNHDPIRILWEELQDPESAQLVRRAVELILSEIEQDSKGAAFDRLAIPGHAESIPD